MKINEIIGTAPWRFGPAQAVVGLDIGSRGSKGVLLKGNEIYTTLIPTGLFMQETADEILEELLNITQLTRSDIGFIVGTGYGRISLKYDDIPYQVVTEISCHAMGVHAIIPEARTIIDIGGQDSKAIKIDPSTGKVVEFVMNDKCAAGTGRFLEKAANILGIDLSQLGEVALQSKKPAPISSQCVVFAESEVISLRARGERSNDNESRADIAAGIHLSAARRVHNLLGRIGIEPGLVFSGGVSNNRGMWHTLEELLGAKFTPTKKLDMIFAGALGAAVYAGKHLANLPKPAAQVTPSTLKLDLRQFTTLIREEQQAVIDAKGVKKVGYLCNYTPVELLSAAGTLHSRLIKGGSSKTVSSGELFTQSVFCDFTKSCIGNFQEGDPLYKSYDRVYNFHTCANMKRATEVIETFVSTKLLNLPKLRESKDAHDFFREEILNFKDDLEGLTGHKITDEQVREQIIAYNKIRRLYKKISELRKRSLPPLSGSEYLDLVNGFHYLPVDKLLTSLEQVYRHYQDLKPAPKRGVRPLRLMIAGSIVAEGDRRILNIIENEIGAQVVIEDHCSGVRPFYNTLPETGDPYLALANGYLDQAPCARMRPFEDALDFSGKLAKEYDVDGVVYVFLKFCTCYGVSKKDFIGRFQQQGLPVLEISSDYSESDHGQLKTRLEAFVEVLDEKRSTNNTHEQLTNA
jgi:predicted CoA-substrate-specific enzyme activase